MAREVRQLKIVTVPFPGGRLGMLQWKPRLIVLLAVLALLALALVAGVIDGAVDPLYLEW